jgi:hypothetical protein
MKKSLLIFLFVLTFSPLAKSAIGINAGFGIPFVSQYGLMFTFGNSISVNVEYNNLDLSIDQASVSLTMPAVVANWHVFGGAFYIGAGVGQETLTAEAVDSTIGASVRGEVTATTAIARIGWMWGKADGGFWFGMDATVISPSGASSKLTTTGVPASEDVQDVEDSLNRFGETAYTNITIARLGYIF